MKGAYKECKLSIFFYFLQRLFGRAARRWASRRPSPSPTRSSSSPTTTRPETLSEGTARMSHRRHPEPDNDGQFDVKIKEINGWITELKKVFAKQSWTGPRQCQVEQRKDSMKSFWQPISLQGGTKTTFPGWAVWMWGEKIAFSYLQLVNKMHKFHPILRNCFLWCNPVYLYLLGSICNINM